MEAERMAGDEQRQEDGGEKYAVGATTLTDLFDEMGRATFRQTLAGRNFTSATGATKKDLNRQSGSQKG